MKELIEKMKLQFIEVCRKYSSDDWYQQELWNDICNNYSGPDRFYHTLEHLAGMFTIISDYGIKLENKDAVLFAIWFHDIIYNSSKKNNEEKSAEYAKRALQKLNAPEEIITKVVSLIILTKNHPFADHHDFDTKLFLDADLAILGTEKYDYKNYSEAVRKEFGQYPDILYNSGRKKVLRHFLEKQHIYHTEDLRTKLESKAKENISNELKQLSL